MDLKGMIGSELTLSKVMTGGNLYQNGSVKCLLKAVSRSYEGSIKKPLYYLSSLENGESKYLSGLFATNDSNIFTADWKDNIGIKHIVNIEFSDNGKKLIISARGE